jgi:hypothetical protein
MIAHQVFWQELQGDEPAQSQILRLVHDTHSATPEALRDTIV